MQRHAGIVAALLLLLPAAALIAAHAGDERIHSEKDITWIEPGVLALGPGGLSATEVDRLHAMGIRAIADARGEHDDPADYIRARGMQFLDIPIDATMHMNVTQFETFVSWAREQRDEGRPVYVHCRNGVHRAAALTMAWLMAEDGLTFDEADKKVRELRGPAVVGRAVPGLLAYEAKLRDHEPLYVLLRSEKARPADPNGWMDAQVEVLADGRPAPDAWVRVWTEESRIWSDGFTDDKGVFRFTYYAPGPDREMDHLYARASLKGFADGADAAELFYMFAAPPNFPLVVSATPTPDGVSVEVERNGKPTSARILATTANGAHAFDFTRTGRTMLPIHAPGETVTVRAVSWGDTDGSATVTMPGQPAAPPTKPSQPAEPAKPSQPATPARPSPVAPTNGGAAPGGDTPPATTPREQAPPVLVGADKPADPSAVPKVLPFVFVAAAGALAGVAIGATIMGARPKVAVGSVLRGFKRPTMR